MCVCVCEERGLHCIFTPQPLNADRLGFCKADISWKGSQQIFLNLPGTLRANVASLAFQQNLTKVLFIINFEAMTTGLTSLYDKPSRSFFDSVSSSRGQRVARSEWGTPSDTWVKIIVMVVMTLVVVVVVMVVVARGLSSISGERSRASAESWYLCRCQLNILMVIKVNIAHDK